MPHLRNLEAGDLLGRYELLFPAGKGGMGQVWAAKLRGSQGFRKIVALKTLLANEAFSEEMQRMLRDEAMLASHIKSPHVAETLDFDLHEGIPYLVMEWVDGESLADLLQQMDGPMSLRHVTAIANQLCKGLDAAHKSCDPSGRPLGLVHRDVSPPNILISFSGTVKLADFGIAKAEGTEQIDIGRGLKGKFSYMAPEQIQGGPLDERTDVFALAVLLYRLVTTKYPFAGADVGETLWQISSSITPRSPRALNESLPLEVAEVILKGLEKDPEQRFASAEEMRAALERAVPPDLRGNAEASIAELMTEMLGGRLEQRRKKTARALLSVPPGPMDQIATPSIATLKGLTYSARPRAQAWRSLVPVTRSSRVWKKKVIIASSLAFVAAIGVAFAMMAADDPSDTRASVTTDGKRPLAARTPQPETGALPAPLERPAAATAALETTRPALADAMLPPDTSASVKPGPATAASASPKHKATKRKPPKHAVQVESARDLKSPY